MAKSGGPSPQHPRKGKAKRALDGAATDMAASNLSINGRTQAVEMMSLEPAQRERLKANQNRGQKNYYQKEIQFDQTQLAYDGKGAKGKV